jgi:hypothetical protein
MEHELTKRVEALEKTVKDVKSDTTELLEIFNGAKVAGKFLYVWAVGLNGLVVSLLQQSPYTNSFISLKMVRFNKRQRC